MARKKKEETRTERLVLLFTESEMDRIKGYAGKNELNKTFCPVILNLVDEDSRRKELLRQVKSADEHILMAMEKIFNPNT